MLDFSVTFIITIINIFVLFFILRAVLFKPISKFMNARTQMIQDSIERADKDKRDAKLLLGDYRARLASAETEADKIILTARKDAQGEAERIVLAAKTEADRLIAASQTRLEADSLAAMALFRAEAAALVVKAAERLLKRELAGADRMRYAAEVLDRIAAGEEHT